MSGECLCGFETLRWCTGEQAGRLSHLPTGDYSPNQSRQARRRGHWCYLSPLALDDKGRPEVRRRPSLLLEHLQLGQAQRLGRSQPFFQHAAIETLHQLCSGEIVYLPQTCYNPLRSGIHKPASETNQTLAFYLFPERRLAGAENDE